jgi:hypothetical protein
MSFSNSERAKISKYLGYSPLAWDSEQSLTNAITGAQSIADGGSMADDSVETDIQALLAKIEALETAMTNSVVQLSVHAVDEIRQDAARGISYMKNLCRMHAKQISIYLGVEIASDAFSS